MSGGDLEWSRSGPTPTILPGVTIGPGAVIAAGAIVTTIIPADTLVRRCARPRLSYPHLS